MTSVQFSRIEKILENKLPSNSYLAPVNHCSTMESYRVEAAWLTVNSAKKDESWQFQNLIGFQPSQLLALHRWKIWWIIPRIFPDPSSECSSPPETYFILGKISDSEYLLLISVIDDDMGFSFEGSRSFGGPNIIPIESLMIHGHDNSRNSSNTVAQSKCKRAALVSLGSSPYTLIRASMNIIRNHAKQNLGTEDLAGNYKYTRSSNLKLEKVSPYLKSNWRRDRGNGPTFADYLGWCSWDSFYTDLSISRIMDGLESFRNANIIPRFFILDDGWQKTNVDDRTNGNQWGGQLTSFKANFKFSSDYDGEASRSRSSSTTDSTLIRGSKGRDMNSTHTLTDIVNKVKQTYGVKKFLVWHSLLGYWTGVQPSSLSEEEYGTLEDTENQASNPSGTDGQRDGSKGPRFELDNYGSSNSILRMSKAGALQTEPFTLGGVGLVDRKKAAAFCKDYHATLLQAGVDGVKVDAQSVLPLLQDSRAGQGGWRVTAAFHEALMNSVQESFSLRSLSEDMTERVDEFPIIHCMCHSQATLMSILALYGSNSGDARERIILPVVRGSDDFYPLDPASQGPHLLVNAFNALLIAELGLHDWDMFKSGAGVTSLMHAAARAISGGLVYVSDKPHQQSGEVLKKVAFSNGVVPRCIRNARLPVHCLFLDPQRNVGVPLLIQNLNPAGGLVIAAFNIAGSVIENDLDIYRFLSPVEMNWESPSNSRLSDAQSALHAIWTLAIILPEDIEARRIAFNMAADVSDTLLEHFGSDSGDLNSNFEVKAQIGIDGSLRKPPRKPVYSHPSLAAALTVRWTVKPMDIEKDPFPGDNRDDFESGLRTEQGKIRYVGHRQSDGMLFECSVDSSVALTLESVYDFDIVTFAPLRMLHFTSVADPSSHWFAVLGQEDMYNVGGSVLSVNFLAFEGSSGLGIGSHHYELTLLGPGIYSVITTTPHVSIMNHSNDIEDAAYSFSIRDISGVTVHPPYDEVNATADLNRASPPTYRVLLAVDVNPTREASSEDVAKIKVQFSASM